ncbi:MAG: ubiquinol-cytochrome c reductase iron-sulfur subunit [Nocardioides sp.]
MPSDGPGLTRRCLVCALPAGAAAPLLAAAPAQAKGKKIIKASKVKKGKIVAKRGVVVTQPKKGTFRVFSATCTHQGCRVSTVDRKEIGCPCHGSKFSSKNGFVLAGPATKDLPPVAFVIEKGVIYLA